jgi:hypothetical protein
MVVCLRHRRYCCSEHRAIPATTSEFVPKLIWIFEGDVI